MQARIAAKGNCPEAVAITLADQSRFFVMFETNRALPDLSRLGP